MGLVWKEMDRTYSFYIVLYFIYIDSFICYLCIHWLIEIIMHDSLPRINIMCSHISWFPWWVSFHFFWNMLKLSIKRCAVFGGCSPSLPACFVSSDPVLLPTTMSLIWSYLVHHFIIWSIHRKAGECRRFFGICQLFGSRYALFP